MGLGQRLPIEFANIKNGHETGDVLRSYLEVVSLPSLCSIWH
jgi:hypothetical protein